MNNFVIDCNNHVAKYTFKQKLIHPKLEIKNKVQLVIKKKQNILLLLFYLLIFLNKKMIA